MKRLSTFLKNHPVWISYATGVVLALLFLIGNTREIYRDQAAYYAPMAEAFAGGDWALAFPPDIPILSSLLAGLLVRCGLSSLTALMAVGAAFHIATIYPLDRLLRMIYPERTAALGCFLFVIAPKMVRYNCMGLPDSGRTFFFVALVLVLAEYLRNPRPAWTVWGGLCAGGLALVRGEGILYAGAAGAIFLYLGWRGQTDAVKTPGRRCRRALTAGVLYTLAMLVVIAPRLYGNYRLTGFPVCDSRQVSFLQQVLRIEPEPRTAPETELERLQKQLYNRPDPAEKQESRRTFFDPGDLLNDWVRGSYELYLIFAAVGLFLVLRRRQWRPEYTLCMIFMGLTVLIFAPLVVAHRYFLVNIPLMMPFTLLPLVEVEKYGSRFRGFRPAALAGLAALTIGQTLNAVSVFREPGPEYAVGRWIAAHRTELSGGAERFWVIGDSVRFPYWSGTFPRLYWEGEGWHPEKLAAFRFENGSSGVFVFRMHRDQGLVELFQRDPRFERINGHPHADEVAVFKWNPAPDSESRKL